MARLVILTGDNQPTPRAIDGDTLEIAGERVRIANVFAPEISEPGGVAARERLQELVAGGRVTLNRTGYDPHGRTLATVAIDGQTITQIDIGERAGRGADYHELPPAAQWRAGRPAPEIKPAGPVLIPQWDDVLHIQPRPELTPQQRAIWRNVWNGMKTATPTPQEQITLLERIRGGDLVIRDLDQRVTQELARRYLIAAQMQATAVPEWRQKMIRILTVLDNIEDDLSTAERLTRPILARIPGGAVASRVMRSTSQVLDHFQAVLRGPSIAGRREKKRAKDQRQPNVKTRGGVLGGIQKGLDWVKRNWGPLLEGAQSADNHLGVGLQLGAIYGALEEAQDRALMSAWNAGKWAAAGTLSLYAIGAPDVQASLREQQALAIDEIRKTGVPLAEQLSAATYALTRAILPAPLIAAAGAAAATIEKTTGIDWFRRLAGTSQSIAYATQSNPAFDPGEIALALYRAPAVNAFMGHALNATLPLIDAEQLGDLRAPAPRIRDSVTRDILEDMGALIDLEGHALNEGAERPLTLERAMDRGLNDWSRHNPRWLPASPASEVDHFMHALAETSIPVTAFELTGAFDGIRDIWEPELRAVMMAEHLGTYPPRDIARADIERWMHDQVAAIAAHPEDYNERTAAAITARHWTLPPTVPH